jgi:hypothetical protein
MKLAILSILAAAASAFAPNGAPVRSSTSLNENLDDLSDLAKKLNPIVPRFDPLGLSTSNFWGTSNEATIGFIREAEVKHGRIAMFAFVGYIVHANGITWPWPMQMDGTPFPKVSSAPEAWDSISDEAKLQIFAFVGFLEFWKEANSDKHYMSGGKIGDFPDFDADYIPGGALNLFDPFGWSKNRSEADKASGLIKEINNGRLAMLGIFGFLSEQKIEGSVPLLKGVVPHYDGEVMAPLAKSILPALHL